MHCMLYAVIDLTARLTPERAVAELEGLRFKRTEHRMKRYTRGAAMAEAVVDGPLRVMRLSPAAVIDDAMLLDRRWITLADFPWTSRMDAEALVLQHVTYITHRVSVVSEKGLPGAGTETVRVEWDFSKKRASDSDDAERVDWVLEKLTGAARPVKAALLLKRLLRQHKDAATGSVENDDQGDHESAGVRRQDAGALEADGPRGRGDEGVDHRELGVQAAAAGREAAGDQDAGRGGASQADDPDGRRTVR